MTQAICFHCGGKKFGAFTPCPSCSTSPQDEEQVAISLLLADHFMNAAELAETAQQIRKTGKPPALAPETRSGSCRCGKG